jgi:hypothetical protein
VVFAEQAAKDRSRAAAARAMHPSTPGAYGNAMQKTPMSSSHTCTLPCSALAALQPVARGMELWGAGQAIRVHDSVAKAVIAAGE